MENMKKNAKVLATISAVVSDIIVTDSRTGATVTRGKQHRLDKADFDRAVEWDAYKRTASDLSAAIAAYVNVSADNGKAYAAARAAAKKALALAVAIVSNMCDATPARNSKGEIIVPAAMLEYIAQRATTAKAVAGMASLRRVTVAPATFRGVFEDAFCKLLTGAEFADVAINATAAKDAEKYANADAKAAAKAEKEAANAAAARAKAEKEKPADAPKVAEKTVA